MSLPAVEKDRISTVLHACKKSGRTGVVHNGPWQRARELSAIHARAQSQAQYIQNISSLNGKITNTNEGVKFNSYDRYLNKKKGKVLANQGKLTSAALKGNKTSSVSLTSKNVNLCSDLVCN